jgi:hypothetical protein
MRRRTVMLMTLLFAGPVFAQTAPQSAVDEEAVVNSAQTAVVRALDYEQGNRASLMDAKNDFTAGGWKEFMQRMDGWLDDKGAPLGSETFILTGDAVVKSRQDGVLHLSIPGELKQRHNGSGTTYRVVVDVRIVGNPMRIEHLEPVSGGV